MLASMTGVSGFRLRLPSPLVRIQDETLDRYGIVLYLKRDDLTNPDIPGNKWRKLKYNLSAARDEGMKVLLTFGGAYSNHIRAVAAAGHHFGFQTIGVIRGEEHDPLNDVLSQAVGYGMKLTYLDRLSYRDKKSPAIEKLLRDQFGDFYLIPEGGSNALALRGCAELVDEIKVPFDFICCPCGTGGTLAGIATAISGPRRAIGFSVLKGGNFLIDDVVQLQTSLLGHRLHNWSIELDFHMGGFARRNAELDSFITLFNDRHNIQLEWVYVAKMMYGLYNLIERGRFVSGAEIVAVITG